jgi:hypothetical protein
MALIADRWTWIATPRGIKQKLLEGIFGSGPAAILAGLCGPFEFPMSPIGTPTSVVDGSAEMPRTWPIGRS